MSAILIPLTLALTVLSSLMIGVYAGYLVICLTLHVFRPRTRAQVLPFKPAEVDLRG